MSDFSSEPDRGVDDIAICVAVIARDENGQLLVTACNRPFLEMLGSVDGAVPAFPVPLDVLLRQDRAAHAFREKLLACFAPGYAYSQEQPWRQLSADGTDAWRLSLAPIRRVSAGATVHEILVTGSNARSGGLLRTSLSSSPPQRTAAAPIPEDNASRYRALVDLAYDAIVTMDERHNITLFNRAAENLFGYSSADVLGRPIVTLLPEKFRADHPQRVQRFADAYQPGLRQATAPRMDDSNSVYGQHRDGSIIPVEIAVSKIDLNGATEFMAVVRDITDRARLMDILKKQAATDALTGLPNRRGFLEFVQKVLVSEDDLSVFILDIDLFKDINDQHGHDGGDEVLCALAKVGASLAQGPNLFARWGGEEFVAAMPGADAGRALAIAEQLRLRFERQDFEHAWRLHPIPFRVSIGVVTRRAGENDVDVLMKRADQALYRAKASGRNRVEAG